MTKEKKTKDVDFAGKAVPADARKGLVTMFMIMLGFTFFSASMWVGQELAEGLDFWGFLKSLLLGGIILGAYTGLLGYVGAKTGSLWRKRILPSLSDDQFYADRLVWGRTCHVCHSGIQRASWWK